MELALLLTISLLLDALRGDPQGKLHPVALFGRLASWLEKIYRKITGNGSLSGTLCALTAIACMTAIPVLLTVFFCEINIWFGLIVGALCVYVTIAARSLNDHSKVIEDALQKNDLNLARQKVGMIVSRDPDKLDEAGVIRSCLESVGENIIDGVTAAIFFAAVGWLFWGIPGAVGAACFYRAANTLDAMFGYRNDRYKRFGTFAARLDDVLNFIPARLTLIAIFLTALFTGMRAINAVKYAWRDRRKHPSPNSNWGMAAFAGALGVKLGGPTVYSGGVKHYDEWGVELEKLTPRHIYRARILAYGTTIIFSALTCAFFIALRRVIAL
ncbi:MAG: cobalamin biosynthesis protein CobD [Lentisphaerae bacterium]|nr:cobalamin biosynthesis protein CobD [Lentisphaerota bacterium]MCP4101986.1 cobalamin biosynthesis protein CobD [Lentisphaerota bacterium]